MKKLLILSTVALLTACSSSVNPAKEEISVVDTDGYAPLRIDNRVSFYITKEYNDDEKFPKGSMAFFLLTVDCQEKLYKKALLEIYYPPTDTYYKMFEHDGAIANHLREQKFTKIDAELEKVTSEVCKKN